MRNIRISFIFLLSFVSLHMAFSMDNARQERGLLASIAHRVNQELYPLKFYTDDFAPVIAAEILKFDPKHPKHEPYTGDKKNQDDIISALSRHRKGLISLWQACKAQDAEIMETLKKAQENTPGYCSLNHSAILSGFWETRIRATNNYLQKLNQHVAPGILPVSQTANSAELQEIDALEFPPENNFPSVEKVKKEILESHPDIPSKFWHWIMKNYIEDIPHLLDKKSQIVSMATLHLHVKHPHHADGNDIWKLNLNDAFHQCLLYQVIDREYKLSSIIETALTNNDLATITKLDPNNPHNQEVMSLVASSYPPIIRALITGYIHKVKCDKEADEKKRKEQEELIEKSHAVNILINSVRRKLSNAANKEKLQSLSELQKNTPIIAGNKLMGHGAGLTEVRESHKMLTDFSALVEQLLAAPNPIVPSPVLNNSTSVSPTQTIVSTPAVSALSTIAQPQLSQPSPAEAPIVAVPEIQTVPKMLKQESVTTESPQASPPRTPGGSLLEAPADEEFDPRAPLKPAPAKPAAAFEALTPKNSKKNKKGS